MNANKRGFEKDKNNYFHKKTRRADPPVIPLKYKGETIDYGPRGTRGEPRPQRVKKAVGRDYSPESLIGIAD